jgi:hypothetical protein
MGSADQGFDLRLMSVVNGASLIPADGRNLVVVAAVDQVLHFRIFDNDGKMVVDTDEKRLTERVRPIEDLRDQLKSLWPPHELTESETRRVIAAITSIVRQSPGRTILDAAFRYHHVTVRLLHLITGLPAKTVERALANLRRHGLLRSYPIPGGRFYVYTPTAKAARTRGFDERRYRRPPGDDLICEHLTLLMYCYQFGHTLLTPREFAAKFPEQAACPDMSHRRYHNDRTFEQPKLTIIVPDFRATSSVKAIVRRVRHELNRRRRHQPWRDLIYHKLFQITVVTGSEQKARKIRARLASQTCPHRVVVVPGIEDLAPRKDPP